MVRFRNRISMEGDVMLGWKRHWIGSLVLAIIFSAFSPTGFPSNFFCA